MVLDPSRIMVDAEMRRDSQLYITRVASAQSRWPWSDQCADQLITTGIKQS